MQYEEEEEKKEKKVESADSAGGAEERESDGLFSSHQSQSLRIDAPLTDKHSQTDRRSCLSHGTVPDTSRETIARLDSAHSSAAAHLEKILHESPTAVRSHLEILEMEAINHMVKITGYSCVHLTYHISHESQDRC
jgi:hypothetical protein